MASTTALFTGLSGLNAHARKLDVIGNNISNINTTAFKSSRMMFAPLFSRTLSMGTRPDGDHGGTNPSQIGFGVKIAGTQRDMTGGSLVATGLNTDLAIEGEGFFIVDGASGRHYTRAGNFQLNAEHDLVTASGDKLQGYGIDADFNILPGSISDINIPLGTLTIARATQNVHVGGNLNADGEVGTRGTIIEPPAYTDTSGTTITENTFLVDLQDPDAASGTAMFSDGDTIRLSGVSKDTQVLPDVDLAVTTSTTVQDLLDLFNDVFGIISGQTIVDEDDASATSGAQLDSSGAIRIVGNIGTVSDFKIGSSNLTRLDSTGSVAGNPMSFSRAQTADGESVRTQFLAYDSLGTELLIDLSFVMESKENSGNTWRYYAESNDDTDRARALTLPSSPTIKFDPSGNLTGEKTFSVGLDREDTGAVTPLSFTVDLESEADRLQQLANPGGDSEIAATFQDGVPIGSLTDFGVGTDGVISGAFSNGLTRDIGQVALATFRNPAGLVDDGNGLFTVGPNSGTAAVVKPLQFGAGRVVGGTLELSNVDLSHEFTELILTTTGYSASTRIISTTNEMMQQLLLLGR